MKNLNETKISVENPNWLQKIVIYTANLLLWYAIYRHKGDTQKQLNEIKEIIALAFSTINACNEPVYKWRLVAFIAFTAAPTLLLLILFTSLRFVTEKFSRQ